MRTVGQNRLTTKVNTMQTLEEQVTEFHKLSGHPVEKSPTIPEPKLRRLRCKLIMEEALEFIEASGCNMVILQYNPDCTLHKWDIRFDDEVPPDLVGVADAIGDLNYVVQGAALTWGIPAKEVGDEVHRSNMTKVHEDGTLHKREDGKVVKPKTFSEPDFSFIIDRFNKVV